MNGHHLLQDLALLLLVSLPINLLFHRIKIPSTVGFLLAGVIIGPSGLQLIDDAESIENLSEIGIVVLLFVIGLEFSLSHLLKNLMSVIGLGTLQLLYTLAPAYFILQSLAIPSKQSFLIALLVGMSSTAIVLKMLTDHAEIDTQHGRKSIGILLFQDICVVPIMLIIPLLSQAGESSWMGIGFALGQSVFAVAGVFLVSRFVVPRALGWIGKTGSKEHLTLFVIFIILGTGWLSETLGLTLAMGAFIAGLILSETEYNYQIILDILPLRDYFVGIFFISIGMLLDVHNFFASAGTYMVLAFAAIALKVLSGTLACLTLRTPFRISSIVGIRLAQVGEFALLMAGMALETGLFGQDIFQSFLTVSILTMLVSPLLIQYSQHIAHALFSWIPVPESKKSEEASPQKELSDHVIIAGYDLGGRHLAHVLGESKIPFLVVDLNAENIKQALTENIHALFGDATHREILHRAGIQKARMIVFMFSDYTLTTQAVRLARKLNPELYIMVRTRYADQVQELLESGANQVIPEEFETSIEMFSRVLKEYHIPNNIIEQQIELVRLEGYAMFRGVSLSVESMKKFSTYLTASLTESFQVLNSSWSMGRTLKMIDLKGQTGVTLIAIVRNRKVQAHPTPDFVLENGDILILFGNHAQLAASLNLLQSGGTSPHASN